MTGFLKCILFVDLQRCTHLKHTSFARPFKQITRFSPTKILLLAVFVCLNHYMFKP
uniref:Uncharacterized protein n=1 Tax=Rhizophora mucronata TaxID=61149 RepID=A0A2P2QBW5_RHIMU